MAANMADLLQLMVDRGASDLHITSGTHPQIRETAQSQGMKTLRQNALQKVLDGVMTVEEVLRVTLS